MACKITKKQVDGQINKALFVFLMVPNIVKIAEITVVTAIM